MDAPKVCEESQVTDLKIDVQRRGELLKRALEIFEASQRVCFSSSIDQLVRDIRDTIDQ